MAPNPMPGYINALLHSAILYIKQFVKIEHVQSAIK
jgi:hypothetical protein